MEPLFNTVRKPTYNLKARQEAYNDYLRISDAIHAIIDSEEDETPEGYARYQALEADRDKARLRCWALQFHSCKNPWFAGVVESFGETDGYRQISERQYYAFSRYANEEDCNSWRSKEQYARVGNYLVTLKWKNANRSIKIERFE